MSAEDAAFERRVRVACRALLPTLDLNTVNEKQLRLLVSEKLGGVDITAAKKIIKDEIEVYLMTLEDAGDLQAPDLSQNPIRSNQASAAPAPAPPQTSYPAQPHLWTNPQSNKRPAPQEYEEEEPKPPAQKMQRTNAGGPVHSDLRRSGSDLFIEFSGPKRITVNVYNNKPRVDFRKFYVDNASGEHKPTKDGISLSPEQFDSLAAGAPQLSAALHNRDVNFRLQLGDKCRAQPSSFKGNFSIDIREVYTTKEGAEGFTKKGLNLGADQWNTFTQNIPAISQALSALIEGRPLPDNLGTEAPPPQAPQTFAKREEGGAGAGAGAGAGPRTGSTPTGEWFLELSGPNAKGEVRRITVSRYKGAISVNVREFYQKDGQFAPGATGLALTQDQWHIVYDRRDAIQAALDSGSDFSEELGASRRLTVSQFKGRSNVGLREYYSDRATGEMKPGKKGINLTAEQWGTVMGSIELIEEKIKSI